MSIAKKGFQSSTPDWLATYYVHRHTMNYLNWGTYITNNPTGDKNIPGKEIAKYRTIRDNLKAQYQQVAGVNRDKELERTFEKYVYGKGIDNESEMKVLDGFRQELIEAYGEVFEDRIRVSSGNLVKGYNVENLGEEAATIKENMKNSLQSSVRNVYQLNKSNSAYSTTFQNIRNKLTQLLEDIGNTTEFKDYMAVQNKAKGMAKTVAGMISQINSITEELLGKGKGKSGKFLIKYNPNTANMKILKSYIEILGTIPALDISNDDRGTLGEMTTAVVDYALASGLNTIVEEDFKSGIKNIISSYKKGNKSHTAGGQLIDFNFDLDAGPYFNKNYANVYDENFYVSSNDNSFGIRIDGHRNKTDLVMSTPIFGIPNQNVSIKNVSSFKNVHIVGGTTLAAILAALDASGSFAGHYANIVAQTIDGGAGIVADYRQTIEGIITQYILINAFQGYSSQNKPSVFLVYNNNTETVRIYDMNSLIGQILQDETYKTSFRRSLDGASADIDVEGLNNIEVPFSSRFGEMTIKSQQIFRSHKINVSVDLSKYA